MTLSLKWKISLNMWILAALSAVAAGIISSWLLVKNHEKILEQQLKGTATTLISMGITDYSGLKGFEKLDKFIDDALRFKQIEQIINVYTKKGKLMFSSLSITHKGLKESFVSTSKPIFSILATKKKRYKVLTTPYLAKNKKKYFLQIARSFPPYTEILGGTLWQALLLFLILSLISLLIAQLLAKKLVSPVRSIATYLNKFDPRDTRNWMPLVLTKPGEYLNDIVTGINSLMTKFKSSMYSISRTSRYIAHEIRNPLAILTGEAEGILDKKDVTSEDYRDVLKSSLEEVERINNVVSTVLKIVETEKISYNPVPCDLGNLLDENIKQWESFLGKKIKWKKPTETTIGILDPDPLIRLIDNLIRNIKKHIQKPEAFITLSRENNQNTITVEDNGPGMNKSLIIALNKQDTMHPDLGIGLILCLEIASICNFTLSFRNKDKGGLLVQVQL